MQDIFRYPYMSIDLEKPAYDIRGSIIKYTCESATRNEGRNRGKNCRAYISPKSSGACYQNTFGDWHCVIGGPAKSETKMPPPVS